MSQLLGDGRHPGIQLCIGFPRGYLIVEAIGLGSIDFLSGF